MRFESGSFILIIGLGVVGLIVADSASPTRICATVEGGYQNSTFCERPVQGVHATWQYLPTGTHATGLMRGEITRFPTVPTAARYTAPFFDPPITDPRTWSD